MQRFLLASAHSPCKSGYDVMSCVEDGQECLQLMELLGLGHESPEVTSISNLEY